MITSITAYVFATVEVEATWDNVAVKESYVLDERFELPDRVLTVGGKSYDSNVKLFYPNGLGIIKTKENTSAILSQSGIYKLEFSALTDGGEYYSDVLSLTVTDKLWRYSEKSSAVYGHYETADEGTEGLLVKLAAGDTLTFNRIIDLTDIKGNKALVTGFVTPKKVGSYDFDKLRFTFTDAYDSDCYLSIECRRSYEAEHTYVCYWTSWANGQTPGGLYNGYNSPFHHNDGSGTVYYNSFFGLGPNGTAMPGNYPFRLSFDSETMRTYINMGDYLISDHDDPLLYDSEPLWKGFTSGKALLSVTAYGYVSETADFCLTSVLGYDLSGKNFFTETNPPEIIAEIDEKYVDGDNSFIPVAVIGGSYPVPDAYAIDDYTKNVSVKTSVYYNYSDVNGRINCNVVNGRFKVDRVGDYSIVYTASDAMGNTAKKVYRIKSVAGTAAPLSVKVYAETVSEQEYLCGTYVNIAESEVIGGSGFNVLIITVSDGDTEKEVKDGSFFIDSAGVRTVRYVVTDYNGITAEYSYKITAVNGEKPVFTEKPILPEYFISGYEHEVPCIFATDYSSGKAVKVAASIFVTDGNGVKQYFQGEKFIPTVKNNLDEVKVVFKADTAEYTVSVPTINNYENGKLVIENMFVGKNVSYEKNDGGLTTTAIESGDFIWKFANALVAENSGVVVEGIKGKSNFDSFHIAFTDSINKDISVTVNVINNRNGYARIKLGDTERDLTQGFSLTANQFEFSYKNNLFYLGNLSVKVNKDDSGKEFNGFPSGKVYISSKTKGAAAESGYIVKKIDNNVISKLIIDGTDPRIAVNGEYGGMFKKGDIYTVYSAVVSDTIDPNVSFFLSVKMPSGKYVTDENGLILNNVNPEQRYYFTLNESGQYKVEYLAEDKNNNTASLGYGINILDKTAPEVSYSAVKNTAKVGDKISLPKVTVSDDVSDKGKITVYLAVRNPNGILIVLGSAYHLNDNGEIIENYYTFTFNYSGDYTFIILATDEAGNQKLTEYKVAVGRE